MKNLLIRNRLSSTFHMYPYKGSFAIKQTYWYFMTTNYPGHLKPQEEEDITEVRWFTKDEVRSVALADTYYTIADVAREALNGPGL